MAVNNNSWNGLEGPIRKVRVKGSLYALAFNQQDPQDVKEKLYRIILTSPEMCLGDSGFSALLKEPQWSRSILFMVVDEAHCITQWGAEF